MFFSFIDPILATPPELPAPVREGRSREGRSLPAYHFGNGSVRLSLIAGCHADEPTGPRLLRHLAAFLARQPADSPLLAGFSWWIVPHANPDGEAANSEWYDFREQVYDLAGYLRHFERTAPRDDVEFGFPIEGEAGAKRPENAFIYDCWRSAGGPFALHASLHSMAISFGAWFLIDAHWRDRSAAIQTQCRKAAESLGYPLHDVDRGGEKGFHRIAEGFSTRPDHRSMQRFFLDRDDAETASFFHPSSMESIRSLGGDCLTLVTEMPQFILPRQEVDLSWPNPDYDRWKEQLHDWKAQLHLGKMTEAEVNAAAYERGIRAMPVADQMRLQWTLLSAGLETVTRS